MFNSVLDFESFAAQLYLLICGEWALFRNCNFSCDHESVLGIESNQQGWPEHQFNVNRLLVGPSGRFGGRPSSLRELLNSVIPLSLFRR